MSWFLNLGLSKSKLPDTVNARLKDYSGKKTSSLSVCGYTYCIIYQLAIRIKIHFFSIRITHPAATVLICSAMAWQPGGCPLKNNRPQYCGQPWMKVVLNFWTRTNPQFWPFGKPGNHRSLCRSFRDDFCTVFSWWRKMDSPKFGPTNPQLHGLLGAPLQDCRFGDPKFFTSPTPQTL